MCSIKFKNLLERFLVMMALEVMSPLEVWIALRCLAHYG